MFAKKLSILACLLALHGCATSDYFQPNIVKTEPPERPRNTYSLENNSVQIGLAKMVPLIPAYNGQGRLLASWTDQGNNTKNRPTFVIVHGGHGLVPTNWDTAHWLHKTLGANVLVLDSYWSRGLEENWRTYTRYGANMRVLDAIAAARWLVEQQGVDSKQLYLLGDSQGGWTVLRAFTESAKTADEVKRYYAGGIALYPNCEYKGTDDSPKLSPYNAPVLIFTGGADSATPVSRCNPHVVKRATKWVHYPDQTHAWDAANRGAAQTPVDGRCFRAANVYNPFEICRNNATTADMREKIIQFVKTNK